MKLLKYTILALALTILTSCGGIKGNYAVPMMKVENTINFKGDISTKPNGSRTESYYKDDLISIVWMFRKNDIWFSLRNKSEKTMEIIWDKAVYVDEYGVSNKVIHSGVKYKEREKTQLPTVVASESAIIDYLIPVDKVFFIEGKYGGWSIYNLLRSSHSDDEAMLYYNEKYKDARLKVLLPLQIDNNLIEYTFVFELGEFYVY